LTDVRGSADFKLSIDKENDMNYKMSKRSL